MNNVNTIRDGSFSAYSYVDTFSIGGMDVGRIEIRPLPNIACLFRMGTGRRAPGQAFRRRASERDTVLFLKQRPESVNKIVNHPYHSDGIFL
jgi:hypothetical protein